MNLSKLFDKVKGARWPKFKWWWVIPVIIVLIGAGVAYYFLRPQSSAENSTASTAAAYNTSRVTNGSIRITAAGSGTLVADPQINLAFSIAGRVGTLNVKVGDQVKVGQELAKLDSTEKLQSTVANDELNVIQDQQAIDTLTQNAQVNLSTAYQTWVTAQKAYNDALVTEQRSAYARCSKTVNTNLLDKYETALENLTKLSATQYGSDLWNTAKADYDTATANYDYCAGYTQDEITSAKANEAVTKMTVDQAQENYNKLNTNKGIDPQTLQADQAKLKADQLQLAQANSDLTGAAITSPIAGTVISIAANQGEVVDTSTYITIADLNKSKIQVQINETDLNKMAIGNKAEIVFDAVPNKTFTGKVVQINPALTTSGQTTTVIGLISLDQVPTNPANNHLLPLGLNSSVTIINNEASNVLLVSSDALRNLGDGTYGVFVVGQDKKLRFKAVQVGLNDTVNAEIKSGLNLGDTVSTGAAKAAR